ncbi:NADP-dependent oxidoreductase domain-containing protein [Melampsora americana]|nr:NADP-dependent oxidoreductase domain-containing protein [Melampsora americana]
MSTSGSLSIKTLIELNSGKSMPMLGLGVYKSNDAKSSCQVAFEVGYRHIDSARMYRNEVDVIEAAKLSGIERSELFLTTKILGRDHGYEKCSHAIQDSIKSSKADYWDLILLHDPTSGSQKRLEAYRALAEAQKGGLVKSIGVSNFGVAHLRELEAANKGPTPAINQVELHPWCQQREIVDYFIQAYCPLVRGEKMSDPTLIKIAERLEKSPAQVLIRWSLQHGFVPLPKSDKSHRIIENAEVFDFELDEEAMGQLDSLDQGDKGAISWNPIYVD